MKQGGVSAEVDRQMGEALRRLEDLQRQKLGTGDNPLLRQRAFGREIFHAGDDGHDPESWA